MKKVAFLLMSILLVLHPGQAGSAGSAEPTQDSQNISARKLVAMFYAGDGTLDRALALIGDIYASRYNNGIIPERETLYGLGQVVAAFIKAHPNKGDLVAEKVVTEALKGAKEQIRAQEVFWDTAYQAAEVYLSEPSAENGERLYQSLPDRRLPGLDFKGEVRLSRFFYGSPWEGGVDRLSFLVKRAEGGDAHALDIAVRLINISDGAFGEDLVHGLGTVIPVQPRLFLETLLSNRGKTEPPVVELLDSILEPVGWWEVPENDPDSMKLQKLRNGRIDIRIKALKSVEDPALRGLRDRCLSILKKM